MREETTLATDRDVRWCFEAVQDVSRTFSITIDRLDEPMDTHVCVGYLLCRIADTIEDAGHVAPRAQTELLTIYDQVLDRSTGVGPESFVEQVQPWIPTELDADWEVVAEAPRVLRTFESLEEEPRERMRPPVRELVGGMATFTERYADDGGLRLQTLDELESYCWYVAGTVGTLITELLAHETDPETTETLRNNARSFALLLQLVNVAKDVRRDFEEENNVYLPAEWLADEDVPVERLTAPAHHEGVTNVVRRVVAHAEGYLDDAQRYLETMPERHGNTLSAWAIPYLLAVGTLRELRKRPGDVIKEGNVKVTRAEVRAVIGEFEFGNISREDLRTLRKEIAAGTLHE